MKEREGSTQREMLLNQVNLDSGETSEHWMRGGEWMMEVEVVSCWVRYVWWRGGEQQRGDDDDDEEEAARSQTKPPWVYSPDEGGTVLFHHVRLHQTSTQTTPFGSLQSRTKPARDC